MENVRPFSQIQLTDIAVVGGKNASLGEMIQHLSHIGVKVPDGFAITTSAYRKFLTQNSLDRKIEQLIASVDIEDLAGLKKTASIIRDLICTTKFPKEVAQDISNAYAQLSIKDTSSVAVRSSATAEDLLDTSFAGQQESYLNVRGIDNVLSAVRQVYASLFNDRAIAYRIHRGFQHDEIAISVGVQKMVRSDLACSGVIFTLDTESGFDQVILITGSYGLGESIVQGSVNPDEFYVYKPLLHQNKPAIIRKNLGSKITKKIYKTTADFTRAIDTVTVSTEESERFCVSDQIVLELARLASSIEQHYGRYMDIEWGLDGQDHQLYILQARPETVRSKQDKNVVERYKMTEQGKIIATGRSIGDKIGKGEAKVILDPQNMKDLQEGEVLVTDMTDPDWEPVMKKAAAIVTNRGGRTCHAAIIARELGIPAVVGCAEATSRISNGSKLTVCCAEGETGFVYSGYPAYEIERIVLDEIPSIPFKIYMNLGNPEKAFCYQAIPNDGVGLARLEFIINTMIGIHPQAVLEFATLPPDVQKEVAGKAFAYSSPVEFYIEKIKEGVATIAAAFYPKPVIVRFSDFKSNEYANLLGGNLFEPKEENPMMGYRGASRYISEQFYPCFELECIAIKRAREDMGLTNIKVMVPFVRTVTEAKQVVALLEKFGLKSSEHDLEIYMMCEIPSNCLLAKQFLDYFDGFSIGSNDLTQLTLGLDRDSSLVAKSFDERNEAVKALLAMAIATCLREKKYIGICGQGPSDHRDFAKWLLDQGIYSISLSPDTVIPTRLFLASLT